MIIAEATTKSGKLVQVTKIDISLRGPEQISYHILVDGMLFAVSNYCGAKSLFWDICQEGCEQ